MTDEIVSIVTREVGKAPERVIPVEEGLLHETYDVDCGDERYILQFSSDADEDRKDSLQRGLGCYVLLADTDIPVPDVLTETVTAFGEREYTLVEKLPGTTGERAVSPERVQNAGRYLAKIHDARSFDTAGRIHFDGGDPSVEAFQKGSLQRSIRHSVEETVAVLRDSGLTAAGNAVDRVFGQLERDLPSDFQPVLCHDDFSPDNVLFRDGEVVGILDFDRAYSGHDQRDLVKAANCFWMHDPCSDWDIRATLYAGYADENEPDGSFELNESLYRVETLANIIAGALELGELSEYEREFYSKAILKAAERADRP